ncbi:MAG: SLC13/DASS family transporter, partial [Deltaproteobacteria bacterium]|nr:SLC13/DASS family transporter [Deltaproteobacteria bacterium]
HLIYLFMGGFFIAVTMERWDLHRRVALHTIKLVGLTPGRMILGFMIASGFLSAWVSNTATTMMMLPIAMAVVEEARRNHPDDPLLDNFARALVLGMAYASSMGGVATLIGTPPNVVMAGMVEKMFGVQIGFARWMSFGVPLAVLMITISWFILTRFLFPMKSLQLAGSADLLNRQLASLGKISRQEKLVILIGASAGLFWISRGFVAKSAAVKAAWPSFGYVHDATIAMVCALALFIIPVNLKRREFLLDWKTAVKIPWDVIILFGGGLAIAKGFGHTGLAAYVANLFLALKGSGLLVFVTAVVFFTIFMTEITSNTATTTLLIRIMGSAAVALGIHPFATIISTAISASFAFMLPVATPPNAVVFGSGYVTIKEMAKAGLWINLIGAVVIIFFVMVLLPPLWGIDLHSVPAWAAATVAP